MLRGTFTAIITPFREDQIDEKGLVQNIQRQINAGIDGLVFLGTTGESATLSDKEQLRVIEIGVREAKGKTLVLVGTGCRSTRDTIENTKRACDLGADVALIVTPYYNRPTQEGIFQHYEAVANAVDMPIIAYNVPSRTGVNIEPATLARLAALSNIVAVKESSGNIYQTQDYLHRVDPGFSILSGDDAMTLPMMACGAHGLVSVASNLIPEAMVALVRSAQKGDFAETRRLHELWLPLFRLAFIETNPAPIKEMMNLCGLPAGLCRLPLCALRKESYEQIVEVLINLNLRR